MESKTLEELLREFITQQGLALVCPACGKRFFLDASYTDQDYRCPACKQEK